MSFGGSVLGALPNLLRGCLIVLLCQRDWIDVLGTPGQWLRLKRHVALVCLHNATEGVTMA